MLKQTLMVSAIALGCVTGAFAGSLMEQPAPMPVAISNDAGFYAGLEAGAGVTGWKKLSDISYIYADMFDAQVEGRVSIDDDSWVGRVFAGYDFNKYLAVEAGYTYFGEKTTIKFDTRTFDSVRTQVVDLVGKIKAPLMDDFSVYAKVGPAYQMSHHHLMSNDKHNENKVVAEFGVGIDWALTQNVVLNGEWLHINGGQKFNRDYLPAADIFMVGARYKWDM